MAAGLLAAQSGGWIGAPSGDGGAAVPDAWPPSGDTAFAGLLPGYAFAQSMTLNLTATGSITDGSALLLRDARDIAIFTSGGGTYAAVAASRDDGVHILDVTDPSSVTAAGSIVDTAALMLDGAYGITTFESGGSTYAAVAAFSDSGVQILNVTDPFDITAAGSIADTATLVLGGASDIITFESGGSTYAAVAADSDDGVQILDITDPFDITAAGSIDDTAALELDGAWGIATFTSGGSTYAAVAAFSDDGVQILNITDPFDITAAGNIGDTAALVLDGASDITTFESGGSTYAAVTALSDDGVQILDVTDPSSVTAAGSITDTTALELRDAWGITTFTSGGGTYAAVAAFSDDGVQILNITDPFDITAAGNIGDTAALELNGAFGITTFESGGSTYAAVAAYSDDGVQILNVTDPSSVTAAGSISDGGTLLLQDARDIAIFESGGSTYAAIASSADNGVQILDITDPFDITAAGSIGDTATLELLSASGIATFESGGSTYAAVAADLDNGVQILDITDPFDITAAGSITDTATLELFGAWGIATFTSGGGTYAAVAANLDDGVQILNITDPFDITAAGSITDTATLELDGVLGITTFESGGSTYAAVAAYFDNGVQILDITDPSDITAAGSITDTTALELDGAWGITTFTSGGGTYAAVTAYFDDGIQILNVTDPSSVTAAGSITDTATLELNAARDIAIFTSGGDTYAAVAAFSDDGVQILDITDPFDITAAGSITDTAALVLDGAYGITTFESGGSTYAAVAAFDDDGVQILRLTGDGTPPPVANSPPVVGAGADQMVAEGATVTLSGTATDDDPEDTLTSSWSHNSTLPITLGDGSALDTSFTAPNVSGDTVVEFTLTVNDGTATVSDTMLVTITDSANSAPTVSAGADQEVAEGATVTLSGTATDDDPEDTLASSWSHNSTLPITLGDGSALDTSFTAPNVSGDTVVEFTLTVNDGTATVSDTMLVTITDSANSAPTVSAGADQEVAEGATVTLSGTATDDDPEDTLTSSWSHNSTLPITLGDGSALDTSFTAPNVSGDTVVEFTLTVNDGTATVSDTMLVTITDSANSAPTVSAGADQEVAEGSTVSLDGTASDDDPEDTLTSSWSHNSTLPITLGDGSALDTSFTAPNVSGDTVVEFTLTVNDGTATVSDTMLVTITDSANSAPTVSAGADQEVAEGATVTLSGTATDDDPEDTLTSSWSHNSTLPITLGDGSALDTSFTAPNVSGDTVVEFTLTVNDGTATVSDTMLVTITDSANSAPTVSAGADQEVAEGATVTLSGTATDDDPEDTLTSSWSHNSTLPITLGDGSALDTSFTAPNVSGDTVVEFTLTVNDGTATVSDTMLVTITDSANSAPTVSAGADQEVAEGATVTLSGTATDDDPEDTLTSSWSHNSTLPITLGDGSALDTSFTAPNVSGDTVVEFTLTVNDGTATVSDTMLVTITDSANSAPTVSAGADQEVAEGATVTLSGTATDDDPEDTLTSSWSHNSTLPITLGDGSALDTSFTAPNVSGDTVVEFTLTVNDGTATVSDTMLVTITDSANSAPTVSAGADQEVAEGSTVSLDGTASDDDPEDTLTSSWSHNSTLPITLGDGSALDTSFTAPNVLEDAVVEFTLTVNDGTATVSDTMLVTITDSANSAPTVSAGADQEVAEGSTVSLDGTASDDDPEDTLTSSWSHNSTLPITLGDGSALDTSFTAPNVSGDTVVEFTLTVNDGTATVSDTMLVTITDSANSAPTVSAGADQEVAEGSTVSLDGHGDSDDDPEDTLTSSWSHNSTLPITLGDGSALDTSFTAPNVSGDTVVEFTLTVNDGTATVSDTMLVTITDSANSAPTVSAGADQEVAEGSTVSLDGTASDDDPEDTLTSSWSHNSTLPITLGDGSALDTSFTAPNVLEDAVVEFTLTVNDGTATVSDTMLVTITDSANSAPTVSAGADQEVAEGSTVSLDGTASDDDPEDTLTSSWSHNSTLPITLGDGSALDTSFTAPNVSGDTVVEFTLTVNDGTATVSDTMLVTITDSANSAPTVSAGADQEVAEGSTVSLDGTASDDDPEDTLTSSWSHNSTLPITLGDGSALDTSFTAPNVLEDAVVEFTLTVNDGTATVSDTMLVTITDSANSAPTVSAGADQEVAEGSTVSLDGTASDDDPEDTLTSSWSHNSTLPITLGDGSALDTSFTAPNVLEDAVVEFTLTVNDGTATVSDTMLVTITDSANSAPTVSAGADQEVAEGSTVSLDGTASDDDPEDTLTSSWSHNSTLPITLGDGSALDTSFTAPNVSGDTVVEFTLTVNDGTATVSDTMLVTITPLESEPEPRDNNDPVTDDLGTNRIPAVVTDDSDVVRQDRGGDSSRNRSLRYLPAIDLYSIIHSQIVAIPSDILQTANAFDPSVPIRPSYDWLGLDPPVIINDQGYLLAGPVNTLEPQVIMEGESASIVFTVYDFFDIASLAVYLAPHGSDTRISDNATQFLYNGGALITTDPWNLIADVDVRIEDDAYRQTKKKVNLDIEFENAVGTIDMEIRIWIVDSRSTTVQVLNAMEILADPDRVVLEPPSDQEPPVSPTAALRMWTGFGPATIGDAELIAALGLDYPNAEIPPWVKTGLAPLVVEDRVTIEMFTTALEHVLGAIQDRGTKDAAGSQPADTDPDRTSTTGSDAVAPTVTSIERSDPAEESTSETTLVFGVTFSEGVTGVDAGDFALSPDSGDGPGQFTQTSTPALAIPDSAAAVSDAITVPGFGTATSVSVSVDIAHPYIGDLMVELVAPDGTAKTLHRYSGEGADDIIRTYTPDFGGTGIAGDWALRVSDGAPGDAGTLNGWTLTIGHDGAGGSVTGLAGSGSRYLVTVSAPQGGTYNLDVIRDSGITDAAGNPLAGAAPTGPDHTYTVAADTTAPTVTSIERSDPAGGSTPETTLVFGVTFSEDVTGVDADDFALSPDSGGGPGQFTHTRMPGLAIPDNAAAVSDAITVPGFGTATSVSVSVDIAHPYIGDLVVELVAPDGTARTLHDRSGGNADGIGQAYAPDFGGTGIAGDWTLRVSDGAPGDAGTLNGWTLTVGHDGAGGSVTGLAGSGSQYFVTVSAPQGGTYNLDVVQDGGIADAAGNQLADTAPTGVDHTYTVVADTTAPTVASIERSDPAEESTSETTLVFGVTFSEDVTGVDAGDFALSPDSGDGPGQFTQTSTPALAIPDSAAAVSDAITVPGFGTATSVTVSVDIAHPFIGDLTVELVAPDGTARTLHDRNGDNADGIEQTYTPDFDGTGIAGDWALRVSDGAPGDAGTLNGWTLTVGHDGAGGSVTGLAGSGSQYFVTVSAPQGGTYNLDVVQDGGIADAAGNQLADTAPTGVDHTYTVVADTTAPTVASIERSDPAEESTSETTLVFGVTFSEDVTGVDAGDFALSPDSGDGPGQFTQTSTPALAIPDSAAAVSDAITVPGFGTATSVTVSVDIAHPFIGDLTVELVAPDGTARTLHDRNGDNADGIEQTYTPDFDGTGIAGDWALRVSDGAPGDAGTLNGWTLTIGHDGAGGSVTGLAGSGSRYLVTVSAPQGGTYNLDVIRDSGITDAAGNPLAGTAPYRGG